MTAMTTSSTSSASRSARWAAPVQMAGATLIGLIGAAHLLVVHVFSGADSTGEEVINELSRSTTTTLFDGGRRITVFDLNTGYSVGMGLFGLLFGLLVISAVRAAPQLIARWSFFNVICVAMAGGTCWIAALYFPEPVIVVSALATLCFAAVLVAGPVEHS
ncbi:LIC_13387 family protein [Nocardia nepalensis]|uniref:LIC_13387 family protein n=1 Tax=Nocardia nepalensis TaxID=3375448 RepID=UPI003B66D039